MEDSAEADDFFGAIRAVDDFNGDGFADLAVGVYGEDVGSKTDAGSVNVLYGSATGIQATSPADQLWHEDVTGVADSAEGGDVFGLGLT